MNFQNVRIFSFIGLKSCWTFDERAKQEVCENCVLFSETRCLQYGNSEVYGKAVNKEKGKEMEVPCTITFTGSKQMLSKLEEVL